MEHYFSHGLSSNDLIATSWGHSMDSDEMVQSVRDEFLPDFQLWIAAMIGVSLAFMVIKALVGNL